MVTPVASSPCRGVTIWSCCPVGATESFQCMHSGRQHTVLTWSTFVTLPRNTCRPGPSPARLAIDLCFLLGSLLESGATGMTCSRKQGPSLPESCIQHHMTQPAASEVPTATPDHSKVCIYVNDYDSTVYAPEGIMVHMCVLKTWHQTLPKALRAVLHAPTFCSWCRRCGSCRTHSSLR
jgi:hypothetical protein